MSECFLLFLFRVLSPSESDILGLSSRHWTSFYSLGFCSGGRGWANGRLYERARFEPRTCLVFSGQKPIFAGCQAFSTELVKEQHILFFSSFLFHIIIILHRILIHCTIPMNRTWEIEFLKWLGMVQIKKTSFYSCAYVAYFDPSYILHFYWKTSSVASPWDWPVWWIR